MKKVHISNLWTWAKKMTYSKYVETCAKEIKGFIPDNLENLEKNLYLSEIKPSISYEQHKSIWLFCEWIATMYRDTGEMYVNPMDIELIWTKDLVYNIYWKALMKEHFNKEHLKDLLSNEVTVIADAIIMFMNRKGYPLEFPSWQGFLNKIDSKNYDKL